MLTKLSVVLNCYQCYLHESGQVSILLRLASPKLCEVVTHRELHVVEPLDLRVQGVWKERRVRPHGTSDGEVSTAVEQRGVAISCACARSAARAHCTDNSNFPKIESFVPPPQTFYFRKVFQ